MTLTATGLDVPTLEEIRAAIETQARATIDPRIDLSESSPQGQLVGITARQIRKAWESLSALYAAADPDGATGVALDHLAALTGTVRAPATRSRVACTVDVAAGTYAAGSLVAHVAGRPDARFASIEEVTGPGGAVPVVMEAEEPGPIAAPAGTLTEIASPVTGWNSITNATEATLGEDRESDPELRRRRRREVAGIGSASTDAIRAEVSALPGVIEVLVRENTTDAVDALGLPPKSVETLVWGPDPATGDDDQAVAEAIHRTKAAGIESWGLDVFDVTDASGTRQTIGVSRVVSVPCEVQVSVEIESFAVYPGALAVREAILAGFLSEQRPTLDLRWSKVISWVLRVPGVLGVDDVLIARKPAAPVSMVDAVIDSREIATLALADISVIGTTEVDP